MLLVEHYMLLIQNTGKQSIRETRFVHVFNHIFIFICGIFIRFILLVLRVKHKLEKCCML